ncbi:MAG: DUF1405 domain-containing protein [Thermoplasmatota archaeon]
MAFWHLLHRFRSEWPLLVPLLFAAALGMGFGWYYYWQVGQFDPSSPRFVDYAWWPLVSDSPNAVLFWVVAVLLDKLAGWRRWWLDAIAFTLNMYVGLWTTTVFLLYPETMNTFNWAAVAEGNMNPVLFVSHMGMPLLALTLVHGMRHDRPKAMGLLAVLAGLGAYLFVDYWGPHLHPAPFLHEQVHGDAALHAWAPGLMVFTAIVWLWFAWPSQIVGGDESARG